MRNTCVIFTLLLGFCLTGVGQNLNSYKYVSVPEKFEFLGESNEYQMNELTGFLFEKYGFNVFMKNGLKPLDLSMNPCDFLQAAVLDDSGLFQTKLQIVLTNCENQEVFVSKVGRSKEKDFKKAYHEALRDAFSSLESANYSYDENLLKEQSMPARSEVENIIDNPVKENPMQKRGEVIITAVPQMSEEESGPKKLESVIDVEKVYVSGNAEFYILKTEFGYQLYLKQIEEAFAKLIKTESANHFIYSTVQGHGIGYFDKYGNLTVEVLNSQDNSTTVKIYASKN